MAQFELTEALEILARTPRTLRGMLGGLSPFWASARESDLSWSPSDIVAHLIHGENTDWVPRIRIILDHGETQPFAPFDRLGPPERRDDASLDALLEEFETLRAHNLQRVREFEITPEQLRLRGRHPDLGTVTLEQLLATWVVHDLNHIDQASRALAARYEKNVGPWNHPDYLGILGAQKKPQSLSAEDEFAGA